MKTVSRCAAALLLLLALIACESTPAPTEEPEPEPAPVVEPEEITWRMGEDPLAGTSWQLIVLISDYTKPYRAMYLDFSDDGFVTHTTVLANDRELVETERYYVSRGNLYIKSSVGPERKATFKLFGDEMTVNTQTATARLRRLHTDAPREHAAHEGDVGERPLVDHPLAGTFWRSRLVVGDTRMFASSSYDFGPRGILRVELVHRNRSRNVIERFYKIEGDQLILTDHLGHEVPAKMTVRDGDLKIDFQNATVVMVLSERDAEPLLTP